MTLTAKTNETDSTQPHHFVIQGHIIRRGPGRGMHSNSQCKMEGCGKYLEDPIHDYEDPEIAEAHRKMEERRQQEEQGVGNSLPETR